MILPYKKNLKFGILDYIAIVLIAGFLFWFFVRIGSKLDYKWNWHAISYYLIHWEPKTGFFKTNILVKGFISTIKLSVWATILAFFIGIIAGIMRAKGSPGQKFIGWGYVELIRNIPSLVLVFIFYFFVSSQFLDTLGLDTLVRKSPVLIQRFVEFFFCESSQVNAFVSAIITLGIYEGAYVTEIVRGGLSGIPSGQWEAGYALGLTTVQTFRTIVLPQALRNILSPLAGQFISTIKDSAIMSVISIQELTFQGMELMSTTFLTFEICITITMLYFILTFSLSMSIRVLEKKYSNLK